MGISSFSPNLHQKGGNQSAIQPTSCHQDPSWCQARVEAQLLTRPSWQQCGWVCRVYISSSASLMPARSGGSIFSWTLLILPWQKYQTTAACPYWVGGKNVSPLLFAKAWSGCSGRGGQCIVWFSAGEHWVLSESFPVLLDCLFPGPLARANRHFFELYLSVPFGGLGYRLTQVSCLGYMEGKKKNQGTQSCVMPHILR